MKSPGTVYAELVTFSAPSALKAYLRRRALVRDRVHLLIARVLWDAAVERASEDAPFSKGSESRNYEVARHAADATFLAEGEPIFVTYLPATRSFDGMGGLLRDRAFKAVKQREKESKIGIWNDEALYARWLRWCGVYDGEWAIAQSEADLRIEKALRSFSVEAREHEKRSVVREADPAPRRPRKSASKPAVTGSPAAELRQALTGLSGSSLEGGVIVIDARRFKTKMSTLRRLVARDVLDEAMRLGRIEVVEETPGLGHKDPHVEFVVHDDFEGPLRS